MNINDPRDTSHSDIRDSTRDSTRDAPHDDMHDAPHDASHDVTRDASHGERLQQATTLLRQHTDTGWTAIRDDILARVTALYRPSAPVRGSHGLGDFFLASDVVVAHLRPVVDELPHAAAQEITCTTGEDDVLESVTIQLIVRYGSSLLHLAEKVHTVARRKLEELLGSLAPPAEQVHVHVHIGNVSNDPRIVT